MSPFDKIRGRAVSDDGSVVELDERQAAQLLASNADVVVQRQSDPQVWQVLMRLSGGRLRPRKRVEPGSDGWHDTASFEHRTWRTRAAYLRGAEVFGVDYVVCAVCRLGYVDNPYTVDTLQRCGLASAGLAAVRSDNPGIAWHTYSGHLGFEAEGFWSAIGKTVPGGYIHRALCEHIERW
jgi:hypothetical protein